MASTSHEASLQEELVSSSTGAAASEQEEGSAQWEWCGDSLDWNPYPFSTSALIDAAFQSRQRTFDFYLGPSNYTIHFQPLQPRQKNLATGKTRSVRRQASTERACVSWLWWEDERQIWHAYDDKLAAQVEEVWKQSCLSMSTTKRKAPAGLLFAIHGQAYSIEFEADGVQYNLKTQFSRSVRRNACPRSAHLEFEAGLASEAIDSGFLQGMQLGHGASSSTPSATMLPGNSTLHNIGQPIASSLSHGGNENMDEPSYDSINIVDLENPPDNEDCSICLCGLHEGGAVAATLVKCNHMFHRDCIESWFKSRPSCPECLTVYGTIIGTQPPGQMHVQYIAYRSVVADSSLAGYPKLDVIKITYAFPSGIQTDRHPNPGKPYTGTVRTAYLPKNREGEEVLELLKKAWTRRLLFRIGTSVTTGQNNVVTWASIHHKTRTSGGSSHHGYPDDTYFTRVKKELEDVGVL
eukprot:c32846_g1_i1 orf=218-1612(+)